MSTNDIEVGDVVRIGKGKVLWTVKAFESMLHNGVIYAVLQPLVGYTMATATLDRLTVVTKAGAA